MLNCSRPQVSELLGERIIEQIKIGTGGMTGRTRKAVAIDEVREFESRLTDAVVTTDQLTPGLTTIVKASERLKTPGVDIIHLILGGYLSRVYALGEASGPDKIRVDRIEVLRDLMDDGPSGSILPFRKMRGLRKSYRFRRIMEDDLTAFREAYAPTSRLATAMIAKERTVEGILRRKGIHPKFRSAALDMAFYVASNLPPRDFASLHDTTKISQQLTDDLPLRAAI